jgi:CHAT domain-containing protein
MGLRRTTLTCPLPFDLKRAHTLYRGLFSSVTDLIDGKRLLMVPSGPLTTLPLQVLVTEPVADTTTYADAVWLGVRQPITVLPSVASLQALRKFAKAVPRFWQSPARRPSGAELAGRAGATGARDHQRCPDGQPQRVATVTQRGEALTPLGRAGLVDVADLKGLLPLPETADELCAVARSLGAPEGEVRLGARATETELKALSASGRLADYRVVHFATHGALSGDIQGSAEPGLVWTPPSAATATDDGYLTASEIAQLKLDADWVVLSPCNTAGGGAKGAEPLSGLARAFFYAGARALLVSHWSVDSAATVRLITGAFAELERDPTIGRAEALRRAELSLIKGGPRFAAHPAYWAPFVVVGDGSR